MRKRVNSKGLGGLMLSLFMSLYGCDGGSDATLDETFVAVDICGRFYDLYEQYLPSMAAVGVFDPALYGQVQMNVQDMRASLLTPRNKVSNMLAQQGASDARIRELQGLSARGAMTLIEKALSEGRVPQSMQSCPTIANQVMAM